MPITKKSKKISQASLEFVFFVGLSFVFVFLIGLQQLSHIKDIHSKKESELVYDLALKLQEEARTASLVEDGYFRNFSIPQKLDSFEYNMTIDAGFLTVTTDNSIYTIRMPNVTGGIKKGYNVIKKEGGVLYISQ